MSANELKLALIVSDEKNQAFYQNHLSSYDDIALEVYPNFIDLCRKNPLQGRAQNIKNFIGATDGEWGMTGG